MKKRLLVILLSVAVMFSLIPAPFAYADSWWQDDDGLWYYLDDEGYCQIGWRLIDGSWYFFDYPYGDMTTGGPWWIDNKPYYFADSGELLSGWGQDYAGDWYYANPSNDNVLASGWLRIGGYWYYFDPYGCWLNCGGVEKINGKMYYLDLDNGRMRTGWIKETYTDDYGDSRTDWYYADSSGVLQQGWRKIGGKWYYFAPESESDYGCFMCCNDVYRINGELYAFDENGALRYGWTHYSNNWSDDDGYHSHSVWVYSDSSGYVQRGWRKISGYWYLFKRWGVMAADEWYQDSQGWCYLGSNGRMVTNGWARDSVGWMWLNGSGRITKSSWIKYNGDWYYLKANGYMATGTQTIGGRTYTFDSSGKML